MTEEEITDYELRFSSRRTDVFSAEMCESFRKYIIESRRSKAKMAAIENEFNEGHIESVQIRSTGDVVTCHNIIVKKFGRYYWLEVNSTEKCTMGLLKFDETASGWQEVVVTEDPTKLEANIYRMRVIEDAADKDPLQYSIDNYCEKY